MNTKELGFNTVCVFEQPIIINGNRIYGMFHKTRWIDLSNKETEQIDEFITYLFGVGQLIENDVHVEKDLFWFSKKSSSEKYTVSINL